jgi:GNAT superfamily N-acetyltransferase
MAVRELADDDRPWLRELVDSLWGLPVVSVSGAHDAPAYRGYVAELDDERAGAATYQLNDGSCELLTLNSLRPGAGVGTALFEAVRVAADAQHARLWLITTDDNTRARQFYEHRGMHVHAVHRDFVDVVRRHKPDADLTFRDALEFTY